MCMLAGSDTMVGLVAYTVPFLVLCLVLCGMLCIPIGGKVCAAMRGAGRTPVCGVVVVLCIGMCGVRCMVIRNSAHGAICGPMCGALFDILYAWWWSSGPHQELTTYSY